MIGEKTLKRNAISLFSSSGIGDLGLKANDITTIIGCDILPERMNLFQHNYPEAKCFCGNIWDEKKKIIDYYRSMYKEEPFLILATPPCQGMSSNGNGCWHTCSFKICGEGEWCQKFSRYFRVNEYKLIFVY